MGLRGLDDVDGGGTEGVLDLPALLPLECEECPEVCEECPEVCEECAVILPLVMELERGFFRLPLPGGTSNDVLCALPLRTGVFFFGVTECRVCWTEALLWGE